MTNRNVEFCRALLKQVLADVAKHTTPEERKAAWTYRASTGTWEFHGPREFYWTGRAENAYEARWHGWHAWLEKHVGAAHVFARDAVDEVEPHRLVADASALGLPPGSWPHRLRCYETLGNDQPFVLVEVVAERATYRQDLGALELRVFND